MKKYSDDEIFELEEQAELKQRRDAAMRILEPEKPDPVAVMREREAQRREDQHKANMNARARRLEGMVATEAGRYNPQQQAAALKWLEDNGYGKEAERRRQFDVTNETERIKAREHANGLINQGKTQAEIKAAAEREMSRNKDGWWDDQGNFHPGASVKAAEATGQWKSELNESNWQHRKDQTKIMEDGRDRRQKQQIDAGRDKTDAWRQEAELDRQANKDKANARMKAIQERRDQQDAIREQKDFEAFLVNVGNGNIALSKEERKAFKAMTPDEKKAFWKKKVGRETGEEENKNIQTDKQGVKWEIVFDSNGNKIGRKRVK